jgi:hypothetical protein
MNLSNQRIMLVKCASSFTPWKELTKSQPDDQNCLQLWHVTAVAHLISTVVFSVHLLSWILFLKLAA